MIKDWFNKHLRTLFQQEWKKNSHIENKWERPTEISFQYLKGMRERDFLQEHVGTGQEGITSDWKKAGKYKIDVRKKSLLWEWWGTWTGRPFWFHSRFYNYEPYYRDGSKTSTLETEGCTGTSGPYILQFIICCPKEHQNLVWCQGACTKDDTT